MWPDMVQVCSGLHPTPPPGAISDTRDTPIVHREIRFVQEMLISWLIRPPSHIAIRCAPSVPADALDATRRRLLVSGAERGASPAPAEELRWGRPE